MEKKWPKIVKYAYGKKKSYKTGNYYPALVVELEAVDGGTVSITALIRYDNFRLLGITEDMFEKFPEERGN